MNDLENIQTLFFQVLFQVPQSCPKLAGHWDTGSMLMKSRIMKRKINFSKYLKTQNDDSLSHQIFKEQERLNAKGLSTEAIAIATELNILEEYKDSKIKVKPFKNITKKNLKIINEKYIRQGIEKYSKMESVKGEKFEVKEYLKKMNLNQIRSHFRYRMNMLKVKFNFKNIKNFENDNWQCDSCEKSIDTQSHILWCPAYQNLREGKSLDSDDDLIEYITKVMLIREKLNLRR